MGIIDRIGANTQKLINALQVDQYFQDACNYTFKYIAVCNIFAGQSINTGFTSQGEFVNRFCHKMPYFPASLFHDEMTILPEEIAECKNYIIDSLFITICIDKFIDKYKNDVIACQNTFQNFAITSTENAFMNSRVIGFDMVDRHIPHYIQVIINMPDFTINKYEDFRSIKDFLNSQGQIVIDIKAVGRSCIARHVMFPTNNFKAFTKLLQHGLAEYRKDNSL